MLDIAVSAFHSVVRACNCATDIDGETPLCGLGETDRERVLFVHWEKTVFGTMGIICCGGPGGAFIHTSCTVTIGGAPVPWTDDAVSSYSSWHVVGEVVALKCLSDGVDIFFGHLRKLASLQNSLRHKHSFTIKLALLSRWWLL